MRRLFSCLYTGVVLLFCFASFPYFLYQFWVKSKYRKSWRERLGLVLPHYERQASPLIWIHACSVGEVKAVAQLARYWQREDPCRQIVISTITETGFAEAHRSLPFAQRHFYLPIDFPWTMKRLVCRFRPDLVVCSESDFWYHFLSFSKEEGAHIALVNGKISEKSFRRYRRFPLLLQRIFPLMDTLCVQNGEYGSRFLQLGIPKKKIHITPNLKYDAAIPSVSQEQVLQQKALWGIPVEAPVLILGSTHHPEEQQILPLFSRLLERHPKLHLVIVPRHPERAEEVAALLRDCGIAYQRTKKKSDASAHASATLVDEIGKLQIGYAISDVAVVGGSFAPGVGGHNILEPCFCGVPVVFGPHMEMQADMRRWVLEYEAGIEVPLGRLEEMVERLLGHEERTHFAQKGRALRDALRGTTEQTASYMKQCL